MTEVVVSEHILLEGALLVTAHTARLPGWIENMRRGICPLIEFLIIDRLVDAHAPQDDRWMIAVLQNHLFYICNRLLFPRFAADMLPSRKLREHKQSYFVTAIDERLGLRVMRRPHRVEPQFALENIRVTLLRAVRHSVAHVRVTLMPVQSAEFQFFAV